MAIRNKIFIPERIYFLTFTILKWQKIFVDDRYCNLIYKWFDYQTEKYENKVHGYVIMPNHFHGLIYISEKSSHISKLIQNAKRFLAYEIIKQLSEDGGQDILNLFASNARHDKNARHKVFEDNFDAKIIENAILFKEKLNYIHNNPCREPWCLADVPEDYIWSSASNYIFV
jgi:REP element-mobilizing transposase RayT